MAGRSKAWVCGCLCVWDCEFEYNRITPFLSLELVVCFQVEVTVSSLSLVRRNPTESSVPEYDLEDP